MKITKAFLKNIQELIISRKETKKHQGKPQNHFRLLHYLRCNQEIIDAVLCSETKRRQKSSKKVQCLNPLDSLVYVVLFIKVPK